MLRLQGARSHFRGVVLACARWLVAFAAGPSLPFQIISLCMCCTRYVPWLCVCVSCERLGAIVDVGFSHWLTCGVGCPLHRTMPHDITARIEYSEKYQDDTYEYR